MIRLLIILLLVASTAQAARLQPEKWYQAEWCSDGQIEYVLSDLTRVDCLTEDYAIEFDFADKWAEAIGQSLHYAAMTKRTAGIVLIVEQFDDIRHVDKLLGTINAHRLNIRVWLMRWTP